MQNTGIPILRSKLRPPQLKNVVPRPRLMKKLLEAGDKALVVVHADAGYGKTTLAAQYLQAAGVAPAWYRPDEGDASCPAFLSYLTEALLPSSGARSSDPHVDQTCLPGGAPDTRSAVACLLTGLERSVESPAVLVLDDYQAIDHSREVRFALEILLSNLPETLRVVILTRRAPSLKLGKLSAAGQVLRLDSEDLAFSPEEIRDLWTARGFTPPDTSATVRMAGEVTQGWAAGLILFLEWARRGKSDELHLSRFLSQREVYDYLAQEVFDRQPESVRRFLLSVCVLDEVGEREAVEIAGATRSAELFAHIEKESLFFRRTAEYPTTYACHPLFAEFLQRRVERDKSRSDLAQLHVRAAQFYERCGDLDRGIRHGLLSGDVALIGSLGERQTCSIVYGHRLDLAERLAKALPDPSRHAWALALLGLVRRCKGDHPGSLSALQMAQRRLRKRSGGSAAEQIERLVFELLSLTYIAMNDYATAGRMCKEALATFPRDEHSSFAYSGLCLTLGLCDIQQGDVLGGLRAGQRGSLAAQRMSPVQHAVTLMRYGVLRALATDYLGAQPHMDRALDLAREHNLTLYVSWMANGSAEVAMQLGHYEDALNRARESVHHGQKSSYYPEDSCLAQVTLASVLLGMGDADGAATAGGQGVQAARRASDRQIEAEGLAALSTLARTRSSAQQAKAIAAEAARLGSDCGSCVTIYTRLAHAAAVVASGDLQEASSELMAIAAATRKPGFDRSAAWCSFLRAEIARRSGRFHHCDQHLSKALTLARENQYVHLMIVEGRCAPELLIRALEADIEADFAADILSRIGPWVLPHAEGLLNSGDRRLALSGVRILADAGRSWARRPLLNAVRSRDPEIAKAAGQALASLPVQQEEKLRITAFGEFRVLCGDREVIWRKRKAKYLLEYLFISRRRGVLKDVILDTFWPNSSAEQAPNTYHVTFHALKRSLNPHLQRREQLPYFRSEGGMLQLNAETFSSDVDDFLEAAGRAERLVADGEVGEGIELLRACSQLYTGDLMEDNLYSDWTLQPREELRERYFDAMNLFARLLDELGEHEEAARVLRRLCARDKTREDLHLKLAEQYVRQGNRALAANQVKLCQRALHEELGVEMLAETRRAFDRLLEANEPN